MQCTRSAHSGTVFSSDGDNLCLMYWLLLQESQRAQTKNVAMVSAVSNKVEEQVLTQGLCSVIDTHVSVSDCQHKLLKDFSALVTQIGDQTDEMAAWSPFVGRTR